MTGHFNLQDGEIDQYELQEILTLAFANCKYRSYSNVTCLYIKTIKYAVVVVVAAAAVIVECLW